LSNAEENRNALGVSASLTELAILHFQADDFTGAEELNKQALIVHEQNGFIAGAITNYIHLAEIYTRLSKQDEALAVLYKGLQLAEQIKVKPKNLSNSFPPIRNL
jgi:tetratricopeptide (TPR) repeat protein